jgi:TonB family protein
MLQHGRLRRYSLAQHRVTLSLNFVAHTAFRVIIARMHAGARITLRLLALVTTWVAMVGAQPAVPRFNSQGAKAHVGERAMVCGQVVDAVCKSSTDDVLLTLAPESDPDPFRVRISAGSKEAFGRGIPHRYYHRVVCTVGTITRVSTGYEMTAQDPRLFTEPTEFNMTSPPSFAPDAYGTCDANTKLPTVTREVKPRYTDRAYAQKITGSVWMMAVVEPDGSVGHVSVRRVLHPELDRAALDAAARWKFKPGTYRDEPVPMAVGISMTFTMK